MSLTPTGNALEGFDWTNLRGENMAVVRTALIIAFEERKRFVNRPTDDVRGNSYEFDVQITTPWGPVDGLEETVGNYVEYNESSTDLNPVIASGIGQSTFYRSYLRPDWLTKMQEGDFNGMAWFQRTILIELGEITEAEYPTNGTAGWEDFWPNSTVTANHEDYELHYRILVLLGGLSVPRDLEDVIYRTDYMNTVGNSGGIYDNTDPVPPDKALDLSDWDDIVLANETINLQTRVISSMSFGGDISIANTSNNPRMAKLISALTIEYPTGSTPTYLFARSINSSTGMGGTEEPWALETGVTVSDVTDLGTGVTRSTVRFDVPWDWTLSEALDHASDTNGSNRFVDYQGQIVVDNATNFRHVPTP